jgi:hypothetical protein
VAFVSRTLVLLVACGVAACSHVTEPARPNAIVTVEAPTLTASVISGSRVTWLDFSVPLVIRNTGSVAITFEFCASRVEARSGDTWRTVWTPICALAASSINDIPPGESRTFNARVVGAVEGVGSPKWTSGGIGGAHRFVAGLILPGVGGLIPTVASNEFTLSFGQ